MSDILDILLALFSGLISGVVITLIAAYLQNKNAKETLKIQLAQDEKNLKLQLLHDDKTKALTKLFEIGDEKYEKDYQFLNVLRDFLNGPLGGFIPSQTAKELNEELKVIDELADSLGPPEPSEAEDEYYEQQMEEYYKTLPPDEQIEHEIKNRISALKSNIKKTVLKDMTEI